MIPPPPPVSAGTTSFSSSSSSLDLPIPPSLSALLHLPCRSDGRSHSDQLRPPSAHLSLFSQETPASPLDTGQPPPPFLGLTGQTAGLNCDGSARFCQGRSEALASVTGPAQSGEGRQRLMMDRACIQLAVKPRTAMGAQFVIYPDSPHRTSSIVAYGSRERYIETVITRALYQIIDVKAFPRTTIQIVCHVVSWDGCMLSVCFNAIMLAIADAGIKAKFCLAVSIGCCPNPKCFLLDPTEVEMEQHKLITLSLIMDFSGRLVASSEEPLAVGLTSTSSDLASSYSSLLHLDKSSLTSDRRHPELVQLAIRALRYIKRACVDKVVQESLGKALAMYQQNAY
eukprot:GHVS01055943.1.p1 GENE.GHVS01055943.1~~GHVS01055943.1.p1  ORF type:complete len:364 (+),score=52.91 GHVS01055943.1:72-1094(+)